MDGEHENQEQSVAGQQQREPQAVVMATGSLRAQIVFIGVSSKGAPLGDPFDLRSGSPPSVSRGAQKGP
jgi:hypothetical protein